MKTVANVLQLNFPCSKRLMCTETSHCFPLYWTVVGTYSCWFTYELKLKIISWNRLIFPWYYNPTSKNSYYRSNNLMFLKIII